MRTNVRMAEFQVSPATGDPRVPAPPRPPPPPLLESRAVRLSWCIWGTQKARPERKAQGGLNMLFCPWYHLHWKFIYVSITMV